MPMLAKPQVNNSLLHLSPQPKSSLVCAKERFYQASGHLVLGTINLNTFLQRSKLLLNTATRWAGSLAADELGAEGPGLRNTPGLGHEVVDDWVVVLEVAAETFVGEGGPGNELGHSLGMLIPVGVLGHQLLERLWELLGSLAILEEHDSAVSITVTLDLGLVLSEDGSWQSLALSLHIVVPELVVLGPEEDDGTAGLDRERRGSVLDGMVDTHDNAAVGDGRLLCEGEDGAADLDGLEEWSLVSHCCGCVGVV